MTCGFSCCFLCLKLLKVVPGVEGTKRVFRILWDLRAQIGVLGIPWGLWLFPASSQVTRRTTRYLKGAVPVLVSGR